MYCNSFSREVKPAINWTHCAAQGPLLQVRPRKGSKSKLPLDKCVEIVYNNRGLKSITSRSQRVTRTPASKRRTMIRQFQRGLMSHSHRCLYDSSQILGSAANGQSTPHTPQRTRRPSRLSVWPLVGPDPRETAHWIPSEHWPTRTVTLLPSLWEPKRREKRDWHQYLEE